VKVLLYGTFDRDHPRNLIAIAAMRDAGIEVRERHAPVPPRGGLAGALGVYGAELRLTRPRRNDADVVLVGYPGHFDVPRARRIAGKRPLVFDAVLSLEDELVVTRQRFPPRSTTASVLRAVDHRALRLPDLVVCGTAVEARFLESLGAARTAVALLGADEDVFCETWQPTYPFSALHVRDGSTDVVRAVESDVPVRELAADDDPGLAFSRAGIVLGSFRESRAIPPAVFSALATGAPVVTADTEAARELLTHEETALLVPPESPAAIAGALERLARDEPLRVRLAAAGRDLYLQRASRRVLGAHWRTLLEQTLR
jgi:glycosyltransferase involved in cell wall biosynthesis